MLIKQLACKIQPFSPLLTICFINPEKIMSDITDSSLLYKTVNSMVVVFQKNSVQAGVYLQSFTEKIPWHYTIEDSQFRTLMRKSGGSLS